MTKNEPQITVDELMRRIREEVVRRQRVAGTDTHLSSFRSSAETSRSGSAQLQRLPRRARNDERLETTKAAYDTAEFLAFSDEALVRNAYACLLKRDPDPKGLAHFLTGLRTGKWDKVDVLGRLRYSREGRGRAVPVAGLLPGFAGRMLFRAPVLGPLAEWLYCWLRLPLISKKMRQLEASLECERKTVMQHENAISETAEGALHDLASMIERTAADQAGSIDELRTKVDATNAKAHSFDARLGSTDARMDSTDVRMDSTDARIASTIDMLASDRTTTRDRLIDIDHRLSSKAEYAYVTELASGMARSDAVHAEVGRVLEEMGGIRRQILDHKRNIVDQQRRLTVLLDEMRSPVASNAPTSTRQSDVLDVESGHLLDAFYVAFEDQFRGTREEIRSRVSVYLDVVRNANAGTADAPIVDVACGRGEWLELLRDEGLVATGVDINRIMVAQCRELGLRVEEKDLLHYLKGLDSDSLGAISGLHIIEHLPFEHVIALFDEALRVLRPGGVAIFETPNPENIIVGSCQFYYDPTHRNPLPPEATRFVLHARGFPNVDVKRLHPLAIPGLEADGSVMHRLLTASQDYAVIGIKD
jgi:SAM-dependent methyltransferase